jgi:galactoside O-acetyltransferase
MWRTARGWIVSLLSVCPIEAMRAIVEESRLHKMRSQMADCGKNVVISSGFHVETPHLLSLGDDVSVARDVSIMGAGGCVIGRNSMIATRSLILTTTHDHHAADMHITSRHEPVIVENDVWIGAGAVLLPGSVIRRGAVVGAGAVVVGEVPMNSIVVGVPAKVKLLRTIA